jgi:tRNA(Ile)-lysidine synthase
MPITDASAPVTSDEFPVTGDEFKALMRSCGPFEPAPHIAVALSGGSDSLALTLLAADWAQALGGSATALTVDHGLRAGSGVEARRVAAWLRDRGIEHHILRWTGDKPATGIQAAARRARYELLSNWCRRRGILHLLLGHQREDQAETFILRQARGSGPDGLACMAGIAETPWLRMLRPCLDAPRGRLRAVLETRGQEWVDDPSNLNPEFTRVRIRASLAASEDELGVDQLTVSAREHGLARAVSDRGTARLLGRAVSIYPAGYCRVEIEPLASASEDDGRRALARVVTCIGGQEYGPRRERLDRLYDALRNGLPSSRTLAGCVIARRRGGVLVAREAGTTPAELPLKPGIDAVWDGRFRVRMSHKAGDDPQMTLGALGRDGWAGLTAIRPELRKSAIPPLARPSLPVLRDKNGLLAVPHLNYWREKTGAELSNLVKLSFFPRNPLSLAAFSVV